MAKVLLKGGVSSPANAAAPRTKYSVNESWSRDIALLPESLLGLVRIFYIKNIVNPTDVPRFLSDVPAVCVSGDGSIELQDKRHLSSRGNQIPGLITYKERRISRKKAILSLDRVYASGGFGKPLSPFPVPKWAVSVTVAGPQFEVGYLETVDLVCSSEATNWEKKAGGVIFPHLYKRRSKPSYDAAIKAVSEGNSGLGEFLPIPHTEERPEGPAYVIGDAYRKTVQEDLALILDAFDGYLDMLCSGAEDDFGKHALGSSSLMAPNADGTDGPCHGAAAHVPSSADPDWQVQRPRAQKGWLQLPMIGMGFFAQYMCEFSCTSVILPLFVQALDQYLHKRLNIEGKQFRRLRVLEMCDFSRDFSFRLPQSTYGDLRIVHSPRRSLLEFSEEADAGYLCGVVNAGDVFALPGNERSYGSVESMLGENTSMRRTQVYCNNSHLMRPSKYIPVKSPFHDEIVPLDEEDDSDENPSGR